MPLTAANSMPIQKGSVGQASPAPVDASIFTRKRPAKKKDDERDHTTAQPSTAAIFARRK